MNASKWCVAKNNMQAILYSNKTNLNLLLFMKNWYVEINLFNFNRKYLLVLHNEEPTYNNILSILLL